MVFNSVFLILALLSLICLYMAARSKRRNSGLILSILFVIACDIVCFALLNAKSVIEAKRTLTEYYICHAWLYFGVLWMISSMDRHRYCKLYSVPVLLICIYQTVLIASNALGTKLIVFSKHILLGRSWWVAEKSQAPSVFFSFPFYRDLSFTNTIIIMVIMVVACVNSAKLFRNRFFVLMAVQIAFFALEMVSTINGWPVWITCIVMNPICIVGVYIVNYYPSRTLKDWSLTEFANEMSDGFILYDEYDDLIHMNDLLRIKLPDELTESFVDRARLDEWLSHTTEIDGMEVVVCRDVGQETYFRVRTRDLGDHGLHIGFIYIIHDTTDTLLRIRAMEEANTEIERAARMKSDFLANMSHEIRTPMNAVIGMAEIALREELPANVADYLAQIKNSGRNLLAIINDILDFSKIEAGRMEIIPERYEPLSEINDIANIMMTRVGDKELEIFVISDPDIPHALEGDSMRIRQVIINLANNAVKFTHEGVVAILMSCENISDDEVMMTYHIKDTGMGIKEDDLKKLFVSFQQVDSKRNRSVEGTGLGLAISKRLVEAMGGTIGVTSVYGEGSDFYFSIPQKVLDWTRELIVTDAAHKHAYVVNDDPKMYGMFLKEMEKLGVDGYAISSPDEYIPTGEKDYVFFAEEGYNDRARELLDKYPDITGIILTGFDSAFVPDRNNLHVMRRPETTLNMVMTLNGSELHVRQSDDSDGFEIDFAAPEAKILIVDDNAINITIAEGLMQPIHAQCHSASGGMAAINMIRNNDFDIILMDHMMPEMDGIETTQFIRENIPGAKDTPIIALTANAMEGARDMFLNAGMNDFIAKPIEIKNLVTVLKRWLPENKMIPADDPGAASGNTIPRIDYPGLDTGAAIKAIGMPELYNKIVEEYYRAGESKHADIQQAYEAEDWTGYTIKVHALKSSSRQIGASALGNIAEKLENAGKAMDLDIIHDNHAEALRMFKELLDGLAPYFAEDGDEGDADLPLADDDMLAAALDRLKSACEDLDMDAMESVRDELKGYSYPAEKRDDIGALYKAIDSIDIDTCEELIARLR